MQRVGRSRAVLALLSVVGAVMIAAGLPGAALGQTAGDVKMIPWVELNFGGTQNNPNEERIDRIADGLAIWSLMTDTAIVTISLDRTTDPNYSLPENAWYYDVLLRELEARGVHVGADPNDPNSDPSNLDLYIIPGLKTGSYEFQTMFADENDVIYNDSNYPGVDDRGCMFDDPSYWMWVAADVAEILGVYDDWQLPVSEFLLENELLLKCYLNECDPNLALPAGYPTWCDCASCGMDASGFRTGLRALLDIPDPGNPGNSADITYYWWPPLAELPSSDPNGLIGAVVDPNGLGDHAILTSMRISTQGAPTTTWSTFETRYQRTLVMAEKTGNEALPLAWFYGCGYGGDQFWAPEQISELLAFANSSYKHDTLCIYPGEADFFHNALRIYAAYDPTVRCADLNRDTTVGLGDLQTLLTHYGETDSDPNFPYEMDYDESGAIDLADQQFLLSEYGQTYLLPPACTPPCGDYTDWSTYQNADGDRAPWWCDPDDNDPYDAGATDTDDDGVADCCDCCPNDPDKFYPGVCNCNTPDIDSDLDGTPDCNDDYPNDPDRVSAEGWRHTTPVDAERDQTPVMHMPLFPKADIAESDGQRLSAMPEPRQPAEQRYMRYSWIH